MSTFVYLSRQIDLLADFADPAPGTYRDPEFLEWAVEDMGRAIQSALKQMRISQYQATKLCEQLRKVQP